MNITFTNTLGVPKEFYPTPANNLIPDWYKNLESYMAGEKKPLGDGKTDPTIKRCMPVFDALTGGYILYSYVDVYVSQKDNNFWYEWPFFEPVEFHPIQQAPNYPNKNGHQTNYPKWINSWAIQTPPGYSTLFVQPMHRESVFTILPAIVDTDKFTMPVNFPFTFNNPKYEGLIPAGTPIAQVIPFKRDSWEMSIGTEKDLENSKELNVRLRSRFFDFYKSQIRQLKEYK
jgi:hypothetical protein